MRLSSTIKMLIQDAKKILKTRFVFDFSFSTFAMTLKFNLIFIFFFFNASLQCQDLIVTLFVVFTAFFISPTSECLGPILELNVSRYEIKCSLFIITVSIARANEPENSRVVRQSKRAMEMFGRIYLFLVFVALGSFSSDTFILHSAWLNFH